MKVEGLEAREFRSQKVNILDHTAIVFNSRNAIEHFFHLCKELRITLPEDMKYFGISEKVILYIQKFVQYRKRKVFFSPSGHWPDLLTVMAKHKTEKYLVPLSEGTSLEIAGQLDQKKIKHTECAMFRTVEAELWECRVFFTMSPTSTKATSVWAALVMPRQKLLKKLVCA